MIIAIVKYKPPQDRNIEQLNVIFKEATAMFSGMPGLHKKYFCFDEEKHEGTSVYVWENRETAETCFNNAEFIERFKHAFECEPEITYTELKQVVDNTD